MMVTVMMLSSTRRHRSLLSPAPRPAARSSRNIGEHSDGAVRFELLDERARAHQRREIGGGQFFGDALPVDIGGMDNADKARDHAQPHNRSKVPAVRVPAPPAATHRPTP